ncbi:MAG: hypothetical protein L0G58_10570, partial [Acinetobacter sp.]|nr:hypothetical protein [Acinetobacter sp.]
LFNKAFEKFQKALNIKPDYANSLNNYGSALSDLGSLKNDEALFNKAFEKFQKALEILPDNVDTLNTYGSALVNLAQLKNNESLFNKAFEQFQMALKIQPNDTYNLACYYAIRNQLDLVKVNLLHSEKHNTLPTVEHLSEDKDLDKVRNEQWFIELLERLKTKEEANKVT